MLGSILSFLGFYLLHLPHTILAVVAGSLLHVTLKALFLKVKAYVQKKAAPVITSIAPKV